MNFFTHNPETDEKLSKADFGDEYLLGYDEEYRNAEFMKKLSLAVLKKSVDEDMKNKVEPSEYMDSTDGKFWKSVFIESDEFIENFNLESKGIALDVVKDVGKSQDLN